MAVAHIWWVSTKIKYKEDGNLFFSISEESVALRIGEPRILFVSSKNPA